MKALRLGSLRFLDWPLWLKMAMLLVVVSLLPLVSGAIVDIRESRQRVIVATTSLLTARGDELAEKLDAFHDSYMQSVSRLRRLPAIVAGSRRGASPDALATARAALDTWPASDLRIQAAAIVDPSGTVVVATADHLLGKHLAAHEDVGLTQGGALAIAGVYIGPDDQSVPAITYQAQILDADRRSLGAAVVWIRAAALWERMAASNEGAGEESFAVLLDQDGIRVGHSQYREIVFRPAGTLAPERIDALAAEQRFGPRTRELLSEPRPFPETFERARASVVGREPFQGFSPVNARWNLVVARRLDMVPWTVFYMVPLQTVEAQTAQLTRTKIYFAAGILLLALVAGALFAALILRPVRALARATRALAEGDLGARVPRPRGDEIGELSRDFNHMATQLQSQATALGRARDELERRVQERTVELAESEQRLATTFDSIGDAVIATDAKGHVDRMNPVAEALTGWRLEDARGRPLPEIFRIRGERSGQPVESPAQRVLREGIVVSLASDTALVARDGTTRPIADSAAPIRDEHGHTHGAVLVFRDITSEREAEKERRRAIELTAENRRVLAASQLKSEFLANMSHELRTPLNAIIGFGELLHDEEVGPVAPQQKEFLGNILTSSRHLLGLINDVLDLSKVEAGKMEFRPEATHLRALLGEVCGILRTAANARRVRLMTRVDEGLADIVTDPARVKQVLYNFLSNALKFTAPGGTIEVRIVEDGADLFKIEVEDSGIGIAPEDLPRLFVEFQQLDAGSGKKHGGTGLGLALTKRLVEAQRGHVGVTSVLGKGSVFHATLPRRAPAASSTLSQ